MPRGDRQEVSLITKLIHFVSPVEVDAKKNLMALMAEAVPSPSQPGFFMGSLATKGKGAAEEEKFR